MYDNAKFENRSCAIVERSPFFTQHFAKNATSQGALLIGKV